MIRSASPARRGRPIHRFAVTVMLLVVAGAMLPTSAWAQEPGSRRDALTEALETGRISEAKYALERALSLFRLDEVRARWGAVERPDPHAATLLMRDLRVRLDRLSGSDRAAADRLFLRPTDPSGDYVIDYTGTVTKVCDTWMCYWWAVSGEDAPPQTDSDGDGIPDYIEEVRSTMQTVWAKQIGAYGYLRPRSDIASENNGGSGKLDIYVGRLDDDLVYGYCASDDPSGGRQVSAYCVLDDDYREYGYTNWRLPLRATAAHEFFHTVQFAYDFREDRALMEGTATWMEDEVYDSVNDNRQYFDDSPLARSNTTSLGPWSSLDMFDPDRIWEYGTWIFYRYLSEHYARAAMDPTVIREIWERAIGASYYSTRAIDAVVTARGDRLSDLLAQFGVWNRHPRLHYAEGTEGAGYPSAGFRNVGTNLGVGSHGPYIRRMRHQSNDYLSLTPSSRLSANARVALAFDLPAETKPRATVVAQTASGPVVTPVRLDADGNGRVRGIPFGYGRVSRIVVVLTNGGTRFTSCGSDESPPFFSCYGIPQDDRDYRFGATVSDGGRDAVAPSGSVRIAGGAAYTKTAGVQLAVRGTDAGGAVTQVRISNSAATVSGLLSRGYQFDYVDGTTAFVPWSLADFRAGGSRANGTRRVYVQFRDRSGNWSPVVRDAIVLDTVAP